MKGKTWSLGVLSKQGKVIALAEVSRDAAGIQLRNRIAHAIADSTRMRVTIDGALSNPVPASAMYDVGARWYITTQGGTEVAALFLRDKARSHQIVQAIADVLRVPLVVHEVLRNPHRTVGPRVSPAALAVGETWKRLDGTRAKIVSVQASRIQIKDMDRGEREWVNRVEFLSTWKPVPRVNARRRRAVSRAPRRRTNPAGDTWSIFGGKYVLEEGAPQTLPNLGHVRTFTATGKRGAVYSALLYDDGRFHWMNLSRRGMGSVPFDLAQVSPARFAADPKANPKGAPRVVYNKLLGGWYVVTGPHQTPLNGRFNSKAEAQAWLARSPRGNPTFRVSGTIRVRPGTGKRRRRAPRTRKPRAPKAKPLGAGPAAPIALVPARATARRGKLEPGERVTVPYTGRGSYLGRKVKRTREHATVQGYVGDMVHVMVKRGRSAESHQFPASAVRRVPRRAGSRGVAVRVRGLREKLQAAELDGRLAIAQAQLRDTRERFAALEVAAGQMYPQAGASPTREYSAALAKLRKLRDEIDARHEIVVALEREAGRAPADLLPVAVGDPFANRRKRTLSRGRFRGGRSGRVAVRSKARGNPRESEVAAARRTHRMWHEFEPSGRMTRIRVPDRVPKVLVKLGVLKSFQYESDKFAGGPDNPKGKRLLYEHKTKKPHPVLATDPKGQDVFIVGGDMQVTGDGFVN